MQLPRFIPSHLAVDNDLERFAAINRQGQLLRDEQILRVAIDQSKVNKELRDYTIHARVGDEASQVTEPGGLVPLVKGIKKAVIVGDHVQLRLTVRNMGKALQALLERLNSHDNEGLEVQKTMLDVHYRFSRELNAFPSRKGRLRTGIEDSSNL
ncbi:hypothetical protein M378DRAFT_178610 [Amanita muscaria Koide BX008]|uniref:DNA2/NAM7 helicase helicase domain-containing protein n=1 Tax=Amanita muscaria (strain Koide BX008) TaxID=946122 RepID=A0A0C2TDE6_AMAMK|nr:hypothetical protein M378DRAFT_178610 [Amanita muscaria Koide BX008]